MSQFWPFLQAVCQNGRGSLEWDREVTFEREHLSQGNKRKAKAKWCKRDGAAHWWTVFPICTHFAWEKATQQPPVPLAGWWMERSPSPREAEAVSLGLVSREKKTLFIRNSRLSLLSTASPASNCCTLYNYYQHQSRYRKSMFNILTFETGVHISFALQDYYINVSSWGTCAIVLCSNCVDVVQLAQILLNICHVQEEQLCMVTPTLRVLHLLHPNGALKNKPNICWQQFWPQLQFCSG